MKETSDMNDFFRYLPAPAEGELVELFTIGAFSAICPCLFRILKFVFWPSEKKKKACHRRTSADLEQSFPEYPLLPIARLGASRLNCCSLKFYLNYYQNVSVFPLYNVILFVCICLSNGVTD